MIIKVDIIRWGINECSGSWEKFDRKRRQLYKISQRVPVLIISTLPSRTGPNFQILSIKMQKTIPITGLGGLLGCEMLWIPHCLGNRLIDGGKVVSPTHQPHFTPQKHYFFLMFPVLIYVRG
jgi:hypothetical protein